MKKIEITEKLEAIFKEVSNKTIKALEKEKGNHSNTDNSQFFFDIPFRLPIAPPPD